MTTRPGARQTVRKAGLRQSMAALHTWVGLLPGWLLFVMMLFGTTSYFQQEISRWMRPEMSPSPPSPAALSAADALLRGKASAAKAWTVSLPVRGGQVVRVLWDDGKGSAEKATLDPGTGRPIAVRDTRGGNVLYTLHYEFYGIPRQWGRIIACLAAMAMLVGLLSGIVTHKKIFADFFLLRLGKGQRSWLDAHNASAVLTLPFLLMITYTGLVALLFTAMPWGIAAVFPDRAAYNSAAFPKAPEVTASGRATPTLSLPALAKQAQTIWGGGHVGILSVLAPGDAAATVTIYPQRDRLARPLPVLIFSGATGRLLHRQPETSMARSTQDVMVMLHLGTYADASLRWLFFLSGLGGTVMVGSGLVLWVVKRRARLPDPARPTLGFRIVERLNIGIIAGAPLGIAAYFLANRLLPLGIAQRADHEIDALFIAWGAALVWAMGRPPRRAWAEVLSACAAAFALVSPVSALTTSRGLLPSLIAGDTVFVAFDLAMLAVAALFALAARRLTTRPAAHAPRRASLEIHA